MSSKIDSHSTILLLAVVALFLFWSTPQGEYLVYLIGLAIVIAWILRESMREPTPTEVLDAWDMS